MKHRYMLALTGLLVARGLLAQAPVHVSPNAPPDRPLTAQERCEWTAAKRAMEPYVALARATYPDAKRRYLSGLPARHSFFVVTRLHDGSGRLEQVFIAVDSIVGDRIVGRIWSDIMVVNGYRLGQQYEMAETDLIDWMVSRPDGSEEGNVVGTFLDTYEPPICVNA